MIASVIGPQPLKGRRWFRRGRTPLVPDGRRAVRQHRQLAHHVACLGGVLAFAAVIGSIAGALTRNRELFFWTTIGILLVWIAGELNQDARWR